MVWDQNTYYEQAGMDFRFKVALSNTVYLPFPDWQTNGFDAHSTFITQWPTNYHEIAVRRLDYNTNRFHICVISATGQTNTVLALSNYGFANGDRYELHDAQNYFSVVAFGTCTNATVNLPLNLTQTSPVTGSITNFTNRHSNVDAPGLFNAFVLTRLVGSPQPPPNLRVLYNQ
jgi:hypothetical protein